MTVADQILSFLFGLRWTHPLPHGFAVMNPYGDKTTQQLCEAFYQKYYGDQQERILLLGINPGRFGSGITGISFTDPVKLQTVCGIANDLPKKAELSADFIYRMIERYGGPTAFYQRHFISAMSPLGFLKDGNNVNYYDDLRLQKAATPFIIQSIEKMLTLPISRQKVFCIGEGKNADFLMRLNEAHGWFEEVTALPHPRFIMQYKRKQVDEYVERYVHTLR
ncbi:MAG: DUF4918 family protein [Cyclobacteriaceae bacterium]|jgi:hypothetical protein|nr:DUF4918 family protein [Cyclobacteriaceae bacterium]